MTESKVISDLYLFYGRKRGGKRAKLMLDCAYVFAWESDFTVLNSSQYYIEYEVKISKADYFADKKKVERHRCLSGKIACKRPNKFYYCVPAGLVDVRDVPSYAGLVYYFPEEKSYPNRFVEVKPAPFLHKMKMNLFPELAVKLMYKYLGCRKK